MVIVRGAVYLGLVQSDPLYQFVLLLQFALPPAMNIGKDDNSLFNIHFIILLFLKLVGTPCG